MTKKKLVAFVLILLLFVMSYLVLDRSSCFVQQKSVPYEISVIYRGQNTESWNTMKLGIDQAAEDLNADVSYVTLSNENSVQEQISLLNREVNNGADAVVIEPINSADLVKPLEQTAKQVPVIAMRSTVSGMQDLPVISCDSYRMGRSLASELVKNEKGGSVVILRNGMESSNVSDLSRGISDELGRSGRRTVFYNVPEDTAGVNSISKEILARNPDSVFVALNGETLEAVARTKKDLGKSLGKGARLYGAGRTNAVVSMLDEKVISAVAVDNEYNIGYLCIKSAVDRINQKNDGSTNVNYMIVNRTNMYNSDCQRMLFPFVR